MVHELSLDRTDLAIVTPKLSRPVRCLAMRQHQRHGGVFTVNRRANGDRDCSRCGAIHPRLGPARAVFRTTARRTAARKLACRPGPQSVVRSIGFPLPAIRPSPKGPRVIGASRPCGRYPMTHEPGTDTRERARPAPERSLAPVVPRPAGDIPRRAAGRHKLRRVGWEDRPVCQSGRAGGCPRHRADRALP